MKRSFPKRLKAALLLAALAAPSVRAADVAVYYLPSAQAEYEGLGFRERASAAVGGWDIKLKPKSSGLGLRWRETGERWMFQGQYWKNTPFYAREDGNATSALQRQTGQTRLSLHNFMADAAARLAGSRVWAAAGLQAAYQTLERRDVVFFGAPEAGETRESLFSAGPYFGFRGGSGLDAARRGFYGEWEVLLGHFFLTRNSRRADGGSVRREGYSYAFRLEAGRRWERVRLSAGFVRQTLQVHVPGGKTFPGGAAQSFPINKTDFFSPFLAVTYDY